MYNETVHKDCIQEQHTADVHFRVQEMGEATFMNNRSKFLPLTETAFYILTALRRPAHGYEIMQTVESMSGGDVRIAAGTMYGALDNLSKQRLIQAVPSNDARRKTYQITPLGCKILDLEVERLRKMIKVSEGKEAAR